MMAKRCWEGILGILPVLVILLFSSPQMLSADEGTNTPFQGVIGEFNSNSDTIVINEGPMKVTAETVFKNDKDKKIAKGEFTVGKWVYGVYQTTPNGRVIHKLFLLPGPVAEKDRARYPFMVQDEEDAESGQE